MKAFNTWLLLIAHIVCLLLLGGIFVSYFGVNLELSFLPDAAAPPNASMHFYNCQFWKYNPVLAAVLVCFAGLPHRCEEYPPFCFY